MALIPTQRSQELQIVPLTRAIHPNNTRAKIVAYCLGIFFSIAASAIMSPLCQIVPFIFACSKFLSDLVRVKRIHEFIFNREHKKSLQEQVMAESVMLRAKIIDLENKISKLHHFILSNPELNNVL